MSQISQLIAEAKNISGSISFSEVVKATTGYDVTPLDLDDPDDKKLYHAIEKAAKDFIVYVNKTGTRFQGNRINDIGKKIEEVFVGELTKTTLKPQKLSASGYPDIQIVDTAGRLTYIESKATSVNQWDSTFRSFYYTNGNKIKANAHHLLIGWMIVEEKEKYWKVTGWKLCDLSKLKRMLIKVEFNQGNNALYCDEMLLSESK